LMSISIGMDPPCFSRYSSSATISSVTAGTSYGTGSSPTRTDGNIWAKGRVTVNFVAAHTYPSCQDAMQAGAPRVKAA
jgi:hypothetical protein